jgi:nitrous oxidase accessory protein NosD
MGGLVPRLLAAAAAVACALSCKPAAAPLAAVKSEPAAILFVSQGAPEALADGSDAHPFASIAAAVAKASSGAVVHVGAGEFREQLELRKPISLVGQGAGKTRLVFGGTGAAVGVRADHVELSQLSIEGGTSCIFFQGGKGQKLTFVDLSSAKQQAILGRNTHLVISQSTLHGMHELGRGIDFDGGSLEAREVVFRAAGRRGILLHGTRGVLTDLDVRGPALAAVQATGGATVQVLRGVFADLSGAALYAGAGSRLQVEQARISQVEYGVMGYRGAEVVVQGGSVSDYGVAGVALVNSHGSITGAAFARGGTDGAISITHADGDLPVLVIDNRIHQPGPMGLHVTESAVTVRGNSITGARLDRQNDMGDALYAMDSRLVVENNVLRGNAGSGVYALRSKVLITGNGFIENRRAGVLLLDHSRGTASGNLFTRNYQSGVELGEAAKVDLTRNRFSDNARYDVDSGCGPGSGRASLDAEVRQPTCPP